MSFKNITIHCSATQNLEKYTVEAIRQMHTSRGWSDIGYHFVITTDGMLHAGRPLTRTGAHVKGHNTGNIGICMIGGVNHNSVSVTNFTDKQFETLEITISLLASCYNIDDADIKGHRDWSPDLNGDGEITSEEFMKDCPCFDVKEWLDTGTIKF